MPIRTEPNNQRILGQYMTPTHIAKQMCQQINIPCEQWKIFDPACGDGNLLLSAIEFMQQAGLQDIHSRVMGMDIDEEMVSKARYRLSKAIKCSPDLIQIFQADFLQEFHGSLLSNYCLEKLGFNVILSNPPYGQLREYQFFETSCSFCSSEIELIFLVPIAFIDRIAGVKYTVLSGRPMDVTTGHVIIHHMSNSSFQIRKVKGMQSNQRDFSVLNGVKLYSVGDGIPPQTQDIVSTKPYSSEEYVQDWLPCIRTGDLKPFEVNIGRLWVNYGAHLAHPKDINIFIGPRLFVRRVPIWSTKQLGAAYIDEISLCAGDILIIRHSSNNEGLLKGLCVYLNSSEAALAILAERPSLRYRDSFPKIAAKDINFLLEHHVPSDEQLLNLSKSYDDLAAYR